MPNTSFLYLRITLYIFQSLIFRIASGLMTTT